MARSDLVLSIVKAGAEGDHELFKRSVETLVDEERSLQHHGIANKLDSLLNTPASKKKIELDWMSEAQKKISHVLHIENPRTRLNELLIDEEVRETFLELVEEQHRVEVLRSHGLEPRNRILLVGPPGNGKTSLAHAFADALMFPLYTARYEGIIGSYLGETTQRLQALFEFAAQAPCVLFFDEFDSIGKERGDIHETGEIKRVVSSLLLQIDRLPSHVVVITATNHHDLLDKAVWRRFQIQLELMPPTIQQKTKWLSILESRVGVSFGISPSALAKSIGQVSYSEMEEFGTSILRKLYLSKSDIGIGDIVRRCLRQWKLKSKIHRAKKARGIHA